MLVNGRPRSPSVYQTLAEGRQILGHDGQGDGVPTRRISVVVRFVEGLANGVSWRLPHGLRDLFNGPESLAEPHTHLVN